MNWACYLKVTYPITIKIILWFAICLGLGVVVFQQPCLAKYKLFTVSDAPPEGFHQPKKLTTFIDIYYSKHYLGYFKADITSTGLHFLHPDKILQQLKKITKLTKKAVLKKILSKPLALNLHMSCQQLIRPPGCGRITPDILGLIYHENLMRADLFINGNYLQRKVKRAGYIPDSTSGLSYINRLRGVILGSTRSDQPNYNISTNNTLAFKNTRLNFSLEFANNLLNNRNIRLGKLDIERDQRKHYYAVGILNTYSDAFFSNLHILGGQFGSGDHAIINKDELNATPIELFLSLPSQVSIFKKGELIYSKHLTEGHQRINTENFPQGSYTVLIKIEDIYGNQRETEHYFIKSTLLPPPKIPQYRITAGYLIDDGHIDSNALIPLLPIPIYQLQYKRRLTQTMGLKSTLIAHNKAAYLTIGPMLLKPSYFLEPHLVLGTQNTLGIGEEFSYYTSRLGVSLTSLHLFNTKYHLHPVDNSNLAEDNYNIFINTDYNVDLTVNYRLSDYSIVHLISSLSKTSLSQRKTYRNSLSYRRTLLKSSKANVNVRLSLSYSENHYNILAGLSLNVKKPHIRHVLDLSMTAKEKADGTNHLSPAIMGLINYNQRDANHHGYTLVTQGSISDTRSNLNLQYEQTNRFISSRSNLNTSYNEDKKIGLQYNINAGTTLSWVPHYFHMSGHPFTGNSGIIVNIETPEPDALFHLIRRHHSAISIHGNQPLFKPLSSYQTHTLYIRNASDRSYFIKNPSKQITLYPGNIQLVNWEVVAKHILIGQLVNQKGKPIIHAHIKDDPTAHYASTDKYGYFQIEVDRKTKWLDADDHGNICRLTLPAFPWKTSFTYIGEIVCVPHVIHD